MYATGRTTGLVLDSGASSSFSVALYQGFVLPHALKRLNLAGNNLDKFMKDRLAQNNYNITLEEAKIIKEKVCYIS